MDETAIDKNFDDGDARSWHDPDWLDAHLARVSPYVYRDETSGDDDGRAILETKRRRSYYERLEWLSRANYRDYVRHLLRCYNYLNAHDASTVIRQMRCEIAFGDYARYFFTYHDGKMTNEENVERNIDVNNKIDDSRPTMSDVYGSWLRVDYNVAGVAAALWLLTRVSCRERAINVRGVATYVVFMLQRYAHESSSRDSLTRWYTPPLFVATSAMRVWRDLPTRIFLHEVMPYVLRLNHLKMGATTNCSERSFGIYNTVSFVAIIREQLSRANEFDKRDVVMVRRLFEGAMRRGYLCLAAPLSFFTDVRTIERYVRRYVEVADGHAAKSREIRGCCYSGGYAALDLFRMTRGAIVEPCSCQWERRLDYRIELEHALRVTFGRGGMRSLFHTAAREVFRLRGLHVDSDAYMPHHVRIQRDAFDRLIDIYIVQLIDDTQFFRRWSDITKGYFLGVEHDYCDPSDRFESLFRCQRNDASET